MGLLRERSIESNVILSPNTGLGRDHAREDEDDEDDEVVEVKLNTSGRKGKRKEFPNKVSPRKKGLGASLPDSQIRIPTTACMLADSVDSTWRKEETWEARLVPSGQETGSVSTQGESV